LNPQQDVPEEWLARALLELGPDNVVITLGERGALWARRDGLFRLPALRVGVVDTVGAGDAFNAGLATGMSEDMPMPQALALAVSAASLSTRKRETIDSYPCRDEADSRVAEVLAGMRPC
jgi:ribokinase